MTGAVLFSEDIPPFDWTEAGASKFLYGPKGALLAALPRPWTLPFALMPASIFPENGRDGKRLLALDEAVISRIKALAAPSDSLIVRSSVVGETIWDRGSYQSIIVPTSATNFQSDLANAAARVIASAPSKEIGFVIQRYVQPRSWGEFGNLLRISKTRDQWELTIESTDGATSKTRFNTQRDEAASPAKSLEVKSRQSRERLFGSVAAWLNSNLLRGRSQRLNCEWLTDNQLIYLVQLDEEDEDFAGVNPFQIRVPAFHRPPAAKGPYLTSAGQDSLQVWDKLKVLDELWEPNAPHKPTLFFVPLSSLPKTSDIGSKELLERDFRSLIGPDNIIVRTSVRAGLEKPPNMPRTEGVRPDEAATWCLNKRDEFRAQDLDLNNLAFVTHRFIAAKASAWVRADPGDPMVEIHSLWGLPDALQYCPYDIWEVHVPTEVATEYPEYKSHMLIPRDDGGWEYVRIKNELARHLSIGRREAIDIARRTASIAQHIGRTCHVMWFVGCQDSDGGRFNVPWYWNEAHDAERNLDRSNYSVLTVSDRATLRSFKDYNGSTRRLAVELRPTDLELMRDINFIEEVGAAAKGFGIPVILAGSTLAHAYFQLRRQGCTVVTVGEKEHSRVRRAANLGKLVRDKIPTRIAERQEAEITRKIPGELIKGFLTSKLLEEAMEVRSAEGHQQVTVELADLYEVVRALAKAEGVPLDQVIANADEKRSKAGGFDEGLVLLQTGILGRDRSVMQDVDRTLTQVLARRTSADSYEIPFSFFGFMEFDQVRSLVFENLGIRLDVLLKTDRLEVRLSREAEQFELPLDLTVDPSTTSKAQGAPAETTTASKQRS